MGSAALAQDAQATVGRLARDMPREAAVAWVHSAALVQHATGLGLTDPATPMLDALKALADAHPALAGLTDPAVNRAFTGPVPDLDPVEDLWARHSIADHPDRPDGYLLGDLYQTLSDESRKGRALCQTPRFVTDLLLDLAFDPAYERWGTDLRTVDPSCGTGHILIETFLRVRGFLRSGMGRSSRDDSPRLPCGTSADDLTAAALAAVAGVDLDPYAALLARYRLLALACRLNGSTRSLAQAPRAWSPQVARANSLLDDSEPLLTRGRYHVVLANPPYITVKDATLNERIRSRYADVCSGKYSLALPFFALMNELLMPGGWCAQLTTNSFMKREFGKKFVEDYLPRYDLRWVIDTSGAYIPGHGTPTVILVHRNQPPSSDTVNSVLGTRGEPRVPEDPAKGIVWREIAQAVQTTLSYQRLAAAVGELNAPAVDVPPVDGCVEKPAPQPTVFHQPSLLDLMEAA